MIYIQAILIIKEINNYHINLLKPHNLHINRLYFMDIIKAHIFNQ